MTVALEGPTRPRAVVIGAGVAGLATALALSRQDFQVEIFEARARSGSEAFRGELMHPRGVQLLRDWGVSVDRGGDAEVCRGLVVRCESSRQEVLLDYEGDSTGFIARHDVWLSALLDRLGSCHDMQLSYGMSVRDILFTSGKAAGVRLRSGEEIQSDLTVIAAGRSPRLLASAGLPPTRRMTSRSTVLTLWDVGLPHPQRGHLFLGGPGPVLAYPAGADCVRLCIDLPAARSDALSEDDVRSAFAVHLPPPLAAALIAQDWVNEARRYPNVSMRLPHRWPSALVVVGDAASSSHPLTASGMTRALMQAEITARLARSQLTPHLTRRQVTGISSTFQSAVVADAFEQVCASTDPAGPVLRAGLFRYLRSPRRRRSALRLASAQSLSPALAIREYAVLMVHSAGLVLRQTELADRRCEILGRLLMGTVDLLRNLVRR
jgi:squalene monooxygenase